jgi:hypothetical protein
MIHQIGQFSIVISSRTTTAHGNKPDYFVVLKQPVQKYISSLWHEGNGTYRGDFRGMRFRVNLTSEPPNLNELHSVLSITIGHCLHTL